MYHRPIPELRSGWWCRKLIGCRGEDFQICLFRDTFQILFAVQL
jgi:hypothetical protein